MKTYEVSFGVVVEANYEVKVIADGESKAIEVAEILFQQKKEFGIPGCYTHPDWSVVTRMGKDAVLIKEI